MVKAKVKSPTKKKAAKKKMAAGGSASRNYLKEYANYHASPVQKKRRASRNAARTAMLKTGAVKKGDNKDVSHRNGNPLDNSKKNLGATSKSSNRSYARTRSAGKRNPYA